MTFVIENLSWSFYFYMAFVSFFVLLGNDRSAIDVTASIIGALIWPVFYSVRILKKVNKLLNTKETYK